MSSRIRVRDLWRQLFVAAIAFAAAVALRESVSALTGVQLQYLTFFPAVIAATLFGGLLSGLFTTAFAASMAARWAQTNVPGVTTTTQDIVVLGVFLLTSAFLLGMGWVINRARQASEVARRRLAIRHTITSVLVESSEVEDAATSVLRATCETLHWTFGALWLVDGPAGVLRCASVWMQPDANCSEFENMTRSITFPPGVGLPGRVWFSAQPAWIPDVAHDSNFPRAPAAAKAELHAAFGFPIVMEGEMFGIVEFFSHEIQQPDQEFLQTMAGVGNQLGQFIKRKRAEEALRTSEARKTAMFDAALDGIISMDQLGKVIEFNPAAQRMFGYSHNEALGRPLAELIIPRRLREDHRRGIAHYLATGEGPVLNRRLELPAIRADGTEFPVELSITRLSGEGPPVFTSYIRDISEQKQAALAVQESERRFSRFMQHLPGLAWSKDLSGRYVFANDSALKIFGKTSDELYGKTDVDIFPPETAAQFQDNDRRALMSESGVQTIETLNHDDGDVHYSIVSKFPIPGPDGQPALIGGMAVDVTERMKMEESLKDADRRKDEFLATLAHELRNPLAPISNALHILRLSGDLPPAAERVRDIMERQVNHLVRLVEDLLEVSRVTRGKIELRKEPVDLARVIESAVDTSRPLIEAAGHQLAISLSPEVIILHADPVRLVQVISNLLNNAAKYTETGGQIWLTAQRDGNQVLISVRDNGMGIPPDMLPRVFDMFAQVEPKLRSSQGGLGIGLTLAKNLIQIHGGQIETRSEGLGKGSEFIVRLPLAAPPDAAAPQPTFPPSAKKPLPVRKILVVDDTQAAVYILGRLLEALGQQVRTANSGAAALENVQQEKPDVVISDIAMPNMDGYELAQRLRQLPSMESVVLVALTGYGQDNDRRRALESGFDYHLVKPASIESLQELLASLPLAETSGLSRNPA